MYNEKDLIYSPLQQSITQDGETIEVGIYRLPNAGWTLEITDQYGNSTIYEDTFETDQEALDVFLEDLKIEGIEEFVVRPPANTLH